MHRSRDDCSKSNIGGAQEQEDQRAHERVENLERRIEVRQCNAGEPDVGQRGHGPGDAVDEDDQQEAVGQRAHLLQDARLADGGRGQVAYHNHHCQQTQLNN